MFLAGTLILVLSLLVTPALAANVHLKGGRNAEPSFTDHGLFLEAAGELAGLGFENVVVEMVATADVTSTCTNQGGNQAPGQNPASLTVTGVQEIPKGEIKNGNTPFDVFTVAPDPIIPGAPDCPNPNWTESIDDLAFTSATIRVYQPAGYLVLTVSCTFSPPTSDGPVHRNDVDCSSS